MLRAALFISMLGAACAQTCTINSFPIQIVNGQAVCPSVPPPTSSYPSYADPATVLVVVQDNTGPETGTNGMNGGLYVAQHYMQARKIPAANLVHVATSNIELRNSGQGCKAGQDCDLTHGDSLHIAFNLYQSQVAAPIQAALAANPKSMYVVNTYGVPTHIFGPAPTYQWTSLDSTLAAIQTGSNVIAQINTFSGSIKHIDQAVTKTLIVTRLDGPTAVIAAGLVDKALAGEAGIKGNHYYDWQGLDNSQNDSSMSHAYKICQGLMPVQNCVLNNQQQPPAGSGHMIQSAPNTAFAWGWYDLSAGNAAAYTFVPGAVAAQLNSNSANCVRNPACNGDYTSKFLAQGVTATWGAATEPYGSYALGDILFYGLWTNGFTFGEAAYSAAPTLNWMMIFVGDPLYRPTLK